MNSSDRNRAETIVNKNNDVNKNIEVSDTSVQAKKEISISFPKLSQKKTRWS